MSLEGKRIYVLGAAGYIGWPLMLHLRAKGAEVIGVDNFIKLRWEQEVGGHPILERKGSAEDIVVADVTTRDLYDVLDSHGYPDAIVHLAEQPSAPYSQRLRRSALHTQSNNGMGTLNLIFATAHAASKADREPAHIVKLGTMGEYGTPPAPIAEGWLEQTLEDGTVWRFPYPKQPGSFYHASKVHDSVNLEMVTRIWSDFRVTDLNQGVVWGLGTRECPFGNTRLRTRVHIDECFGTVINRFAAQSALGQPCTVYGSGQQQRGFIALQDSLACIEAAIRTPAGPGEFRVANQITQIFSINGLSDLFGYARHVHPPRVEAQEHTYEVTHKVLSDLGFTPSRLLGQHSAQEMVRELRSVAYNELEGREAELTAEPRIQWRR